MKRVNSLSERGDYLMVLAALKTRHDICPIFYTSRFSKVYKFIPKNCVICIIWDPKYYVFTIYFHNIGIISQFKYSYSYFILCPRLNNLKFQKDSQWYICGIYPSGSNLNLNLLVTNSTSAVNIFWQFDNFDNSDTIRAVFFTLEEN